MPGKVYGKSLNYGFAGNFARNPDLISVTRPNNSEADIVFGSAVMADEAGGVLPVDDTFTAALFAGIAGSETKSATDYLTQGNGDGKYKPLEAVTVIQRGCVSVVCKVGTPVIGGTVYVRIVADAPKAIGDIEATADGANSIALTNAQWNTGADANGVAEIRLLTINRA